MSVKETIWKFSGEVWKLENLAHIGKESAFNEVESGALAHLFETLEQRLSDLHTNMDKFRHSDELKPATPAPAGSDAQALLNLLLTMLKHWRAQEISGNEFEDWLEQYVSLASKLAEGNQP